MIFIYEIKVSNQIRTDIVKNNFIITTITKLGSHYNYVQ